MTIHNFTEQLEYSEEASDELFWNNVYRKAFPNMVNCMLASGDVKSQRMGIDRVVFLSNSKALYIDEKKRRKDWGDILLEYISVDTTNAPGWIEKDLTIDYLAYAFMDSEIVYLFPWNMLQRAWSNYKDKWIGTYQKIEAQNKGYKTISVAVPIQVLQNSVSLAAVIKL